MSYFVFGLKSLRSEGPLAFYFWLERYKELALRVPVFQVELAIFLKRHNKKVYN